MGHLKTNKYKWNNIFITDKKVDFYVWVAAKVLEFTSSICLQFKTISWRSKVYFLCLSW